MASGAPTGKKRRPPRACPGCGDPSQEETYPFCSRRCAEVDLHRWLSGAYSIPGRADDQEDEA